MKAKSFRSSLRQFILSLPLNSEHKLTGEVFVGSHDGSGSKWHLPVVEVLRYGKNGIACVSDRINLWTLNELTEPECEAILALI